MIEEIENGLGLVVDASTPEIQIGLIEKAGCKGMNIGGASVSTIHSNFIINNGKATAMDIENLGKNIISRVREKFGIKLEWEIKIIGK